ncbi:hypothetical protein [Gibbsiella quercinecans]|uniref:hypothetical protein n=1 Tax=Gibbsiella quercinecans TaxID=929813 RepID=UPI00242D7539|nr:hypothetical protein [Gibbsiella quercinecans]
MKSTVKLVITESNYSGGKVGDIQIAKQESSVVKGLPVYRIVEGSLRGFVVNPYHKEQGLAIVGIEGVYYRLEHVKKNSKTPRKRLVRAFVVVGRRWFKPSSFKRNGFTSVNDWARKMTGNYIDDDGDFSLNMMLADLDGTTLDELDGTYLQDFVRDELCEFQ